ncbi:MAG TPA: N-6 DNA methylase, partial [bacterium]|nr:N-6 DNA methylase [bacterium]
DVTMVRLGLMNLMMHGFQNPQIDYKDTLSKTYNENNVYDIIMANPPFTGSIDKSDINESMTLPTTKTELLFVERMFRMLKMGGTAAVIVPQGVLFGSGKAFVQLRKLIIEKAELKAVITMPSGVFKPYAGVATAIIIFTKGGNTEKVWFYQMEQDGYSLDDKRTKLEKQSDLQDIIAKYKTRKTTDFTDRKAKCFFVPKTEIEENNYDLSLSKYKEEDYIEQKYDPPSEILDKLTTLENEIIGGIEELKGLAKP